MVQVLCVSYLNIAKAVATQGTSVSLIVVMYPPHKEHQYHSLW